MTLKEITEALERAGIDNPRGEALILAEAFTGKSRSQLLCETDSDILSESLEEALERRVLRQPLQYILGTWEFMGLPFEVTPDCLIPRSDTEILCEWAIKRIPQGGSLLDLCTGSGCIALSAAHYRPDITVTAVELFPGALALAERNAERLGVHDRVKLVHADATSQTDAEKYFEGKLFDVIVSNPPYITASEMDSAMPELSHEPRAALTDEGDGLSFYRAMSEIYPAYLSPDGAFAYEHGYGQGSEVREILRRAGYASETLRDFSGNDRVTFFEKKNII